MNAHSEQQPPLTKNQSLVFNALEAANCPLSAYTILDELREHGFRAPLQVYRALETLLELGIVHRLESQNAFVACRHTDAGNHDTGHATVAFMICETCGQVTEIADEAMASQLQELAGSAGFALDQAVVELRGRCQTCWDV